MIPVEFSGGTGFIDIGMREADAEAVKRGACEVAEYMVPIREYRLNGNQRYEPMFRYYFKVDGTEVGYFTYCLNHVQFHNTPRVWDAGFRAGLVKDQFRNLCPGPILPDDGRLALDTPERKDQERYFGEGQEPETAEGIAPDEDLPIMLKPQAD